MSRRPTASAVFALAIYAYALFCAPWLHALHHALHGEDHVHTDAGTIFARDLETAHTDFHADLAALALDDAATAGTLAVDCSLAAYTLSDCEGAKHAPRFGDALVAHHPHAPKHDPLHGKGALEHLGKSVLAASPIVLPPRSAPHRAPTLMLLVAQLDSLPVAQPTARGPPA